MRALPEALQPLADYPQFILWTTTERDGKLIKLPVDHRTGQRADAHSPDVWLSADDAIRTAAMFGDAYGVGFVFTKNDPFFFVDIDKCLNPDGQTWSAVATDLMSRLPGAAIEVSQSGRGLHIFGKGTPPDHACKNIPLGIEFYKDGRFVALTGTNAVGSAGTNCDAYLPSLIEAYFPNKGYDNDQEWTTEPVPEWTGPTDDDELIAKAIGAKSVGSVFQGRGGFASLWDGDTSGHDNDASSADAALAQHLAFWTGKNCERIRTLMMRSGLVRDKWNREDYLIRTISRAVSLQVDVYSIPAQADTTVADSFGACKLKGSDAQKQYAESIRALKMVECQNDEVLAHTLAKIPTAKFWIDNKDRPAAEIASMITLVESVSKPLGCPVKGPELVSGYQYLAATQQIEHFKGCVYVQDANAVFVPTGAILKKDQFNATYGGYTFQLDESGDKVTRKAWEALTESQIVRYPKAEATCFRPALAPGTLVVEDGVVLVNTYVPVSTARQEGDVTPFLNHVEKLLPDEQDRRILLSYMAACVQHKGVKFQWTPIIQGAEGNGKTLFTRCVAAAIGHKYTHFPRASEIAEKFNEWLFGKLFIGVEDVYVPDHKKEVIEVLKPMITNDRYEIRGMQKSGVTSDVCANFLLNSNHKDAIKKTRTDRRFAIFYTAQQEDGDIARDGMDGDYFPNLYTWLKNGGYAMVSNFLHTYEIPKELNPALDCHRAPVTSSTNEAIVSSMGSVEQEIIEAIEEGRLGFAGGWVSSVAMDRLLSNIKAQRMIPHNKRREVMQSLGYDYHPALTNGRVNNPIGIDDGKKPRLFIHKASIQRGIQSPAEVAAAYIADQQQQTGGANAGEVFAPKG